MLRVIVLLCVPCSILSAQDPTRELYTEAVLSGLLPGLYGHLYFIDRPNRVRLFSPNGNFASFDVPDRAGEPAHVEGIAIDADGTIAVGWGTRGTLHGIEIHNESGKLIRAIDTGLFVPNNLAFAPDHSLWAFGWQRDPKTRQDSIVVRLNRATSTWRVVPITVEGVFYGAEGAELVFASWPTGAMVLRWFRQPS